MRPWCFIHVPKTGGTSTRAALGPDEYHKTEYAMGPWDPSSVNPVHIYARGIMRGIGAEKWAQVFSFATVRNPWDRAVSLFHHFKRTNGFFTENGFESWLDRTLGGEEQHWGHLIQYPRFADEDGMAIVSFVMRFETLKQDFDTVCQQIGYAAPKQLARHNVSKGRNQDYRVYFGKDKQIEAVAAIDPVVVERYGYTF